MSIKHITEKFLKANPEMGGTVYYPIVFQSIPVGGSLKSVFQTQAGETFLLTHLTGFADDYDFQPKIKITDMTTDTVLTVPFSNDFYLNAKGNIAPGGPDRFLTENFSLEYLFASQATIAVEVVGIGAITNYELCFHGLSILGDTL